MAGFRAKPPKGATLNFADPLADGLIHCIPFLDGQGRKTFDFAAGINATWAAGGDAEANPGWASGRYGKGYSVASTDSIFSVADKGNIAAGDFTLRVVYLPRSLPGTYTNLINKGGAGGECSIYVNTSGQLQYVSFGATTVDSLARGSMPAGSVADLVITRIGSSCQVYVNGAIAGAAFTNAGVTASAGTTFKVGRLDNTRPDAIFDLVQAWKGRALNAQEIRALYADPFRMFRRRRVPVPLSVAGAAGISGSLSVTLDDATLAATATVKVTGTVAATLGAATVAGNGTARVAGTDDSTLEPATLAATATVRVAASLAKTLDDATVAVAGAGTVRAAGSGDGTLEPVTCAGVGAVKVAGSLAVTLDDCTLAAAGSVADVISEGSLAAVFEDCSLAATGTVSGAGSIVVPAASDVRFGLYYDAASLPAPGSVRAGVVYG